MSQGTFDEVDPLNAYGEAVPVQLGSVFSVLRSQPAQEAREGLKTLKDQFYFFAMLFSSVCENIVKLGIGLICAAHLEPFENFGPL
eukprot:s2142_g7.t1